MTFLTFDVSYKFSVQKRERINFLEFDIFVYSS